ncbi:trans-sulfuration enzyme family protein [Desulfuribacillus alkaliarsenatis]|uniref:Cystathionine gamma-synthase n=1 Tax=Desulfuribacillus alkaliarsenatis TaxID=766136 RepID=A0A1E5G123_9FIRM|nr:PLP-dependent aspartate aminotransferase family protein [Desulfuribacillus alkaliarsenatis]OEF96148.1 cystathionine gamma-synthase [Desulfuribacillus alkaliarsenatis]
MKFNKNTILAQVGVIKNEKYGAISTPIYHSATFRHPAIGESTGYDYSRTSNPTRQELETALASLEEGKYGFAFPTGMAALTTIFGLFKSGDHVILSEDLYGGTYRLLKQYFNQYGIDADFIDTTNLIEVEQTWKPNTKGLLIETPSNPLMKITDIKLCAKLCKQFNALFIVDNTFMTPYYQTPINLGADIVIHSGTKYLAGHNDLLAGAIITNDADLADRIGFLQNTTGSVLSAGDSWLLLRSLKTLGLRMERQTKNAQAIVEWAQTEGSKWINQVYYPSINEQGYNIHLGQATGDGAMLSIRFKSEQLAMDLLSKLELFSFAESLGGVESLITIPSRQTHADMPEDYRKKLGVTDDLLRISVGIEDCNDLIYDLTQAINKCI